MDGIGGKSEHFEKTISAVMRKWKDVEGFRLKLTVANWDAAWDAQIENTQRVHRFCAFHPLLFRQGVPLGISVSSPNMRRAHRDTVTTLVMLMVCRVGDCSMLQHVAAM